jgi:PAS domain S-box-containing protein
MAPPTRSQATDLAEPRSRRGISPVRLLASIVESSDDAIISTSLDGLITSWNAAAERLYGHRSEDIIGQPASVLIPRERSKEKVEIVARICDGERVGHYETARCTKDGLTIMVSLTDSPIYDARGIIVGTSSIGRDVSVGRLAGGQLWSGSQDVRGREEIGHRLDQLDAAKTDFVSRVSHELRSPLASVLGYLELLDDGDVGELNVEQRQMLEAMDRNARRLLSLVEDLLTVRVDAAAFGKSMSRVPFSNVVDRVMECLEPDICQRSLGCTVTVEPGIELEADREDLVRMLTNLVSNSIKFTPPGGQLAIAAWTEAGQLVVTVRDTGIGVPVDEQSRLFTRFFRSTVSEAFETQGAGLGLFIVKEIVEAHGGAVRAASTPGGGTTVTVRLPLGQA